MKNTSLTDELIYQFSMKEFYYFFVIFFIIPSHTFSQKLYDSTYNSVGMFDNNGHFNTRESYQVFKGQTLIIRDSYNSITLLKDYRQEIKSSNIYRKSRNSYSNESSAEFLANKTAFVEDVIDYNKRTYLKLNIGNDICYYYYLDSGDFDGLFIVKGLVDKLNGMFLNKQFYLKKGGNALWTCNEISIISKDELFSVDLIKLFLKKDGEEDPGARRLLFFKTNISNDKYKRFLITKNDYEEFRKRFGDKYLNSIMNSEVEIGMTKEMVIMSYGSPDNINKTTISTGISEQWVYNSLKTYVYFENGVVDAFQNY